MKVLSFIVEKDFFQGIGIHSGNRFLFNG
jgi:hypothetical protein